MVTHTRNLCSVFNPSKCTHTVVNTHPEQWASIYAAAPGEQLGVRCLAQWSHLSRGIKGGENARYSLPHRKFLPDLRFEPTTSSYKSDALSIRPRLPLKGKLSKRGNREKHLRQNNKDQCRSNTANMDGSVCEN